MFSYPYIIKLVHGLFYDLRLISQYSSLKVTSCFCFHTYSCTCEVGATYIYLFAVEYEYLEEGCEKEDEGYDPWINKPVFKPDSFELEEIPSDLTFPVKITIYDANGDYAVLSLFCHWSSMQFETYNDIDDDMLIIDIDRITSLIEILKSIAKLER